MPAARTRELWRLESLGSAALAVVLVATVAVVAWWAHGPDGTGDSLSPSPVRKAGLATTKFAQIASAVRAPLVQPAIQAARDPERLPVLVVTDEIHVAAGDSVGLSARIENDDAMEPETVVVLKGLPAEAQLSDGAMIGPGVWMLRPDLLNRIDVHLPIATGGQHDLTLELRTPEGSLVSTAHTRLAVSLPPEAEEQEAPSLARHAEPVRSVAAREEAQEPDEAAPRDRKRAAERVRTVPRGKPKTRTTSAPAERAANQTRKTVVAPRREPKKRVTRAPARRVQSEVTVLSAPNPPIATQAPRLVWPGDDPRTAYAANPPSFVGAFTSNAPPTSNQPSGGDDWHKKVFDPTRAH